MSGKVFMDKGDKPDDRKLSEVLGPSHKHWSAIKNALTEAYGNLVEEWKYYGQKYGWTLKLFHKKRNLFFMSPYDRYFLVAFVFGDRAVSVIEQSGLPENLKEEVRNAKKYGEGRGLRIEVKGPGDVANIITLVEIKVRH